MLGQDHREELIPNSVGLSAGGLTQECEDLPKAGHTLGVQQHSNQVW